MDRPQSENKFQAQAELVGLFLARRDEIVERLQGLLNAQRRPGEYLHAVPVLARHLDNCFFGLAGLAPQYQMLRRELDEAHWAEGFKPRQTSGNDLVDAAELTSRAFRLWQATRWPGQRGRARYAHTLFNVYVLRRLMLLSMRLWDSGAPGDRLSQTQALLDELWRTTPPDQPLFVRDARWLLPLAQSPTTDDLAGYFVVAERIADTLPAADRLAVHRASVRMAGGHLRSQLRHVATQRGVPLDESSLVLSTRRSNALDLATLVQALVPLLERYEHAVQSDDGAQRLELADSICQGIAPDPELFVNRLELLGPYTMIEHLFATTDRDGRVVHTATGQRHVHLLAEYAQRIARMAQPLHDDCVRFRPVDGAYSPYGVLFGFSSNILEHMALKAATAEPAPRFSLEDAFTHGGADKLAWVSGWRKLPHIPRDVARLFAYPQQFAEEIFSRIEKALRRSAASGEPSAAAAAGRLFVLAGATGEGDSNAPQVDELSARYFLSSDRQIVAARKAEWCDETTLLHSRFEGELAVSYRTAGGWVGITKDFFTAELGTGRDAKVVGLPREAAGVLRLMCGDLVASDC